MNIVVEELRLGNNDINIFFFCRTGVIFLSTLAVAELVKERVLYTNKSKFLLLKFI